MSSKETFVCLACGDKQRVEPPGVSVKSNEKFMPCLPCDADRLFAIKD